MPTDDRGRRLGTRARWAVGIVAGVLVLWIVASGIVLFLARQHANDGLDALERAKAQVSDAGLLRGGAADDLRAAAEAFEKAHSLADGPVLAPWRVIPVIGGNVDSVAALTGAAEKVAAVGERTAQQARELLDENPSTGPDRLAMLDELAKVTRRAQRSLEDVDLGDDFLLVGPLGDARAEFLDRFDELRSSLADATAAAEGVERLLAGPRKYLVVAANNGEMRAGSGMLLSAGVATFEGGEFSLGEMRPTPEFNLPAGTVAVPEDLERLWGFAPVGQDWRWSATSPRFELTAPLAADMWEAATGEHVDGVLALDPVVVRAILEAQGPIEVAGRTIGANDVVEFLLREQYSEVDPSVDVNDPEQVARRDQLSAVARGAVDTLSTRAWNTSGLAKSLTEAGKGRHVLAWARDLTEERAWKAAGIGGELHDDSMLVAVENTGGNKLDQFLDVDAHLEVSDRSDGAHDVTLTLSFQNTAPEGLPPYVGGPHPSTDLVAGEYQGIVAVSVPGVGTLPEMDGLDSVLVNGRDGPTNVVAAAPLRLQPGVSKTVTVTFALPESLEEMVVEPSARIPPVSWRFGDTTWVDAERHTVDLT